MNVERETYVILFLIAVVLLPMWYFAVAGATPSHEVTLSGKQGAIAPTETFLPTPAQVDEFVAGVIVWVALLVLVGMIFYTHRFIRRVARTGEPVRGGPAGRGGGTAGATQSDGGTPQTDGGTSSRATQRDAGVDLPGPLPSYLVTDHRWIAEYWPSHVDRPGLIGLGAMAWSATSFAVLFAWEALTYSRSQFLGIYAGMMFLSLGVMVAIYATWFMPSVVVVEERGHEDKLTREGEDA
ncbi:MAG: hypothetical protein ABEJ28_00260 [Salinigranum sp.]